MIAEVKVGFADLQYRITEIETTLYNEEQYNRLNCLIVHGTDDCEKLKLGNVEDHVIKV